MERRHTMPHPEKKRALPVIAIIGESNFEVQWRAKDIPFDLSSLHNFPNLMVNKEGHSHTLQFEKLKQKHQAPPLWQIPDESLFTGDELQVSFLQTVEITPEEDEIDDRPEPKLDASKILFCTGDGVFSMGCHDMPCYAHEYAEPVVIEPIVHVKNTKRRIPSAKRAHA